MTKKTVCITGASGFIGSHLVRVMLEAGHDVRATVRDAQSAKKIDHLKKIAQTLNAEDRLSFWSADLLRKGDFDDAIAGCDWVCHVASAVFFTAKDPQREIVDVAVEGTENVMASIVKSGSVKVVGLTSSIAAISATDRRPGHTYTEADWNEDATVSTNPYGLSKALAEKVAWRVHKEQSSSNPFRLVVVNPVLVFGPVYTKAHSKASPSIVRELLLGNFKGAPPMGFGCVDVRDVVDALVRGMERDDIEGRFILHRQFMWFHEIASVLADAFQSFNVPTRKLPMFLLYLAALFDQRMTLAFVRRNANRRDDINNSKLRGTLGIEPRDMKTSIIETAQSFIELGLVKRP